ncbi:hypothetical protein D3C84_666630 [compost metagenome]
MGETRFTFKHAGPGMTVGIDRAVHHERKLLIEAAMLIRHMVANHPATENVHSLADANMRLQLFFASMPR